MMKAVVGALLLSAASAADLKLTWADCGDSSTHVKITGFTPGSASTGATTHMTGTGTLDEDISAANFDLEMKTAISTVSCKGDASQSKTCGLPLGTGSLTFNAMSFPMKKGSTSVSVDLKLGSLPSILLKTDTTVRATASNGDKLFCIEIKSAPATEAQEAHPDRSAQTKESESMPGVLSSVGALLLSAASTADLKLTWADCGDSSNHVKITGFTPGTASTGATTHMTGTGTLDEDVSAANFDLEMKTAISTVSCKGDASQSKTCGLPLGTGSLTFNAMSFPIKKGSTSVSVDLKLGSLPSILLKTDTTVRATASNGDKLFCIEIKSAPATEAKDIVV